jgi:hypothetical protein
MTDYRETSVFYEVGLEWWRESVMNFRSFDGRCVRHFRALRMMFWTQRALALSFVLSPILITAAARLPRAHDPLRNVWPVLAIFSWLYSALAVSMYIRGFWADRQGVPPAPLVEHMDLKLQSSGLIVFFCIICFALVSIGLTDQPKLQEWRFLFLFTAAFFQQVANYTHSAFWKANVETVGSASGLNSDPSSPR